MVCHERFLVIQPRIAKLLTDFTPAGMMDWYISKFCENSEVLAIANTLYMAHAITRYVK